MKKLIVGVIVIIGIWFVSSFGSNELAKQQYTFDLMCALLTKSEATFKEVNRKDSILLKNGVKMSEKDLIVARNHWLQVYDVSSYQELNQDPEFLMNCNYNACIYDGGNTQVCDERKMNACQDNGLSFSECFPKDDI